MNILVFSGGTWDDTKENGNTFSNFFNGKVWENDNFFNIYLRKSIPNNPVCKNYFQLPASDMIKYYFKPNKIGKKIILENNYRDNLVTEIKSNEQKYINIIHTYSLSFIYNLMNHIYRKQKWLNDALKNYIKTANPDIFFAFATNVSILKPTIEYIKKNTTAKIVLFISDDFYESYSKKIITERNKLKKEFSDIISMADKIYGITDELCNKYSKLFNKNIEILHKGCSFDYNIKNKTNNPIKFVYAGNLLYGRAKILSKIAKAIEKSNTINSKKAMLEIYTGTAVTDKLKQQLNITNSSIIMGKREYNAIKKIENEADYVLHVESFDKKQIETVKFSFSTKIIDCMQCGSCFVAIGPKQIASIKYVKKVPGVHVITNINMIEDEIIALINSQDTYQNAKKIREFAKQNLEITKNQQKLRDTLLNI